MEVKDFKKLLISVADSYYEDHGLEGLIEELFPKLTAGELIAEMYEYGMIPEDVLERFVSE